MTDKQESMLEDIHKDVHRLDKDNTKLNSDLKHLVETVQSLAEITGTNNRKMEDIATLISSNNLLMEKYANLDLNLKESFSRVYKRLDAIEAFRGDKDEDCNIIANNITRLQEQMKVANNRIGDCETNYNGERESLTDLGKDLTSAGEGRLKKGLSIAFIIFSPLILGSYYFTLYLQDKVILVNDKVAKLEIKVTEKSGELQTLASRLADHITPEVNHATE